MILKKIDVTPYSVELWIIITKNPFKDVPQVNVSNPGINITWLEDMSAWTNDHFFHNILAVVFNFNSYDVDTAAHEAIHIKNMIYQYSGIKHDFNNDEPEAYLTGWIVSQIDKAYKELKSKKNAKHTR